MTSFQPLPTAESSKLAFAVHAAANFHSGGSIPASEAMAKAASQFDLSPELTKRAVAMFNSAKTLAHFDMNKDARAADFDLAKIDDVYKGMGLVEEKQATFEKFAEHEPPKVVDWLEDTRLRKLVKAGAMDYDTAKTIEGAMSEQALRLFQVRPDLIKKANLGTAQLAVIAFNADPMKLKDELPNISYGISKYASLPKAEEWIHPDIAVLIALGEMSYGDGISKQAAIVERAQHLSFNEATVDTLRTETIQTNEDTILDKYAERIEKIAEYQKQHALGIYRAFERSMGDLIDSFERKKRFDQDLIKFEKQAFNRLGDDAMPYILTLYKQAGYEDRKVTCPEVKLFDPSDYTRDIQRLSEAMAAHSAFKREAAMLDKVAAFKRAIVGAHSMEKNALVGQAVLMATGQKKDKDKAKGTVDPKINMFLAEIEKSIRRTMLEQYAHEFSNVDPFLKRHDFDVVYSNLKEIADIVPEMVAKKELLRSALTRKLEQGGRMDLDELNTLLNAQKTHMQTFGHSLSGSPINTRTI